MQALFLIPPTPTNQLHSYNLSPSSPPSWMAKLSPTPLHTTYVLMESQGSLHGHHSLSLLSSLVCFLPMNNEYMQDFHMFKRVKHPLYCIIHSSNPHFSSTGFLYFPISMKSDLYPYSSKETAFARITKRLCVTFHGQFSVFISLATW